MTSLDRINVLDREAFVALLGPLYEHSPWAAERAYAARPFSNEAALLAALRTSIDAATDAEKLALIRAHPELAGEKLRARALTQSSMSEQGSLGLDRLGAEELAEWTELNAAYRDYFGFPFIICVRQHTKDQIVDAMRRRLLSDPATETAEALRQIHDIARLRLADLMQKQSGLAALNAQVKRDLSLLADLGASWVKSRTHPSGVHVHDVAIVGGGQSGLGAAFALRRDGVSNTIVLDENPAGLEGPWITYARMVTLRTPKHLTGVETGIPSLTYRSWFEAQHGPDAWEKLDKIPRQDWMAYLCWLRAVLDLPVRNSARVEAIAPDQERSGQGGLFRLTIAGDATPILARKIVLATGIQGGGEWHVPAFIRNALPPDRYAHTSSDIDYAQLAGKRIGILGSGASAFDNAQHALGAGAAEVHVFARRKELQRVNPIRHMERSGLTKRFALLTDAEKYSTLDHFLRLNQPPTVDTFQRAAAYPGFRLHLGAPWNEVSFTNNHARVTTPHATHDLDFLVVSTGTVTDLTLRPELASFCNDIALWRDRYTPPEKRNTLIDSHPYLGPGFQLTPRTPDAAPRLHGLFMFNYSALASLGLSAAALSGLRYALPRLVEGVSSQLFLDDARSILADFVSYDEEEFTIDRES